MSDPARPFDRVAIRRRRDRLAHAGAAPGFLRLELAGRLAERLAEITRPIATVAELGAQRGELAAALAALAIRPGLHLALEPSAAMAARQPRPVVVAEDELLPLAPGRFDAVLSVMSLHLVNDLPGTLVQVREALRPDGFLLAGFPGGESLAELRWCLTQAELELGGGAGLRVAPMIDVRDAGALLQRAGFALPVADSERLTVHYREPLTLLADLRAMAETNPLTARPRTPLARGVLARALELYRARFPGPDGTVRATFDLIFLLGWRPHAAQPQALRPGAGRLSLARVLPPAEHG
jgi:SAM-dependent methyltransferase